MFSKGRTINPVLKNVDITAISIFLLVFVGVLFGGWLFQVWFLPLTPWHAGNGLMAEMDVGTFFEQAKRLAALVRTEGWKEWTLRFEGQWPASLMAAIFVLTGWEKPIAVLPIYAAVYALSALALYGIVSTLGLRGKPVFLSLFVLAFPSTVLIWGQPHKDAFTLAGITLLAWAYTKALLGEKRRRWIGVALGVFSAFGLMWLPRPYLTEVVLVAIFVSVVILSIFGIRHRQIVARGLLFLALVGLSFWMFKTVEKVEKVEKICDTWHPELYIPIIHEKVGKLICYRHAFIMYYTGYGANIDYDRMLTNYREIIEYLPRATFLAIASPIPRPCALFGNCNTTSPGGDVKRLIAFFEMSFFYVVLIGCVFWLFLREVRQKLLVLSLFIFALSVAIFYVLTSPNEGALYRYRFPEIALWWALGVGGWTYGLQSGLFRRLLNYGRR